MSKEDNDKQLVNAPIELDVTADMRIPKASVLQDEKKPYMCTCCGKRFGRQTTYFSKSPSPLYQANNGYLPICNTCRDIYYENLCNLYNGNEAHAIKHFCQQFDIIFHFDAFFASRQEANRTRLPSYIAKKNLGQTARIGSTYIDGMKHDYDEEKMKVVETVEQAKSENNSVTQVAVERWGLGFTEADYKLLEEHYKMLKKTNPNCDSNQEIFIKDLCYTKLLQMKAMRGGGKSDDFEKYTRLYRDTFKQAGLKTVQEVDKSSEETLGVTLSVISQYAPEEYYKDKKLYKDFDGIGSYITRFITRPLKNLQHGSNDRDYEFCVKEDKTENGDNDEE